MKKIVAISLCLCLVSCFISPCLANNINAYYEFDLTNEEKKTNDFYNEISDNKFDDNGIIYVTMHHDVSDVGKVYTEDDFPELDIERIEDITAADFGDKKEDYGIDFRNILKITLSNKTRNNIIQSIRKLQERADKDIYWAEPAYDYTVTADTCTIPNDERTQL